ncbi:5-carboxymethyl-2-hydroxymuconate Delta-isomerase [Acinetobacter sp. ACZLY 512]|uniref:5-carboxymethyl-2-hydroxymuconate Delta-isomerase n=1 Tax=Acinetobacter sp. ACZLY 512 TaxID=2911206 RepID=UPI002026FEB7|nr:5-carboxymethyl-2-hydroxymuconate Delta-isomerase [Acinetobacter sp. ACZLY 512]MCL9675868.1 5-carboxymethyl-2-hydroxymuconate Delta-isomerase [Acinetobacter sp. ACZLY 512]
MPHIIVDYSANIEYFDPKQLLSQINTSIIETGYCDAIDIKSRARKDDIFLIGEGDHNQAYVHVKVYLLSGRTEQQKTEIGEKVLQAITSNQSLMSQKKPIQSCVEIVEMPKQDYFKQVIKSQF